VRATVPIAGPPNKGMKLTKPSMLELCSLSPVFDGPCEPHREGVNAGQPEES
jgi:hypothetical protein